MHGVAREQAALTAEERAVRAGKIEKYNQAKAAFLAKRAAREYDELGNQISSKLITLNPDFYSLWNYRKEWLNHTIQSTPDKKSDLLAADLELSQQGLMKNPKCYSAWHHRLWVIDQGCTDLSTEIKLCDKMLHLDARNFHCWNYRRAVAARAKLSIMDELQFTTDKINENFSNYSAWHYRSKVITRMFAEQNKSALTQQTTADNSNNNDSSNSSSSSPTPTSSSSPSSSSSLPSTSLSDVIQQQHTFLDAEFELIKTALFVEPQDQSGWFYHRWLIGRLLLLYKINLNLVGIPLGMLEFQFGNEYESLEADSLHQLSLQETDVSSPITSSSALLVTLQREVETCSEINELEDQKNKWSLLTYALLTAILLHVDPAKAQPEIKQETQKELTSIFEKLITLDPMRLKYYEDVRDSFLTAKTS